MITEVEVYNQLNLILSAISTIGFAYFFTVFFAQLVGAAVSKRNTSFHFVALLMGVFLWATIYFWTMTIKLLTLC